MRSRAQVVRVADSVASFFDLCGDQMRSGPSYRALILLAVGALTLACTDLSSPEAPASITRGQIVFSDNNPDYYAISLADSNGVRLKTLSYGSGGDFDPAVSADGKKIAFASWAPPEDGQDIWVMNADGSDRMRLTHTANGGSGSRSPAWSPDGKRIAFVRSTGLWDHEISVMNVDGSGVQQLTDDDEAYSLAPEWSPDGSRILFAYFGSHLGSAGIFEMNADGSNVRQLTSDFGWEPTRSPDGTRIAFISGGGVFVMNADGSNATALLVREDLDWDAALTWSPDGKSIVFAILSTSRMCLDWDANEYPCGRDLKRVGLDGAINSTWGVTGAFDAVWQR